MPLPVPQTLPSCEYLSIRRSGGGGRGNLVTHSRSARGGSCQVGRSSRLPPPRRRSSTPRAAHVTEPGTGPSEVLVSQTVKDLVADSGLTFEDAGEHELKGVPARWRLYRVAG
jgi:hypothetical protein